MTAKSLAQTKRTSRIIAAVGGILLLIIAVYHGSGVQWFDSMLSSSSLSPDLVRALNGLWLFFSWHMLVLCVPPIWAAAVGRSWFRPVLLFCGAVTLGDFIWVLWLAGWFPGTVILVVAALCLLTSGYFWEPPRRGASQMDTQTLAEGALSK